MENKINIAEILRECPPGMELDCTMYDNVRLKYVSVFTDEDYPICIETKSGFVKKLTKYGQNVNLDEAKCVIFPKGKTTWEGFHRTFKDGDIIFTCALFSGICSDYLITGLYYTWISIFHKMRKDQVITYVDIENSGRYFPFWMRKGELCRKNDISYQRLATEEEKERLFKYIKDNGYKWNAETKTLEKLVEPKFKVGDRIKYKNGRNKDGVEQGVILSITDDTYDVAITNNMGIFVSIVDQDNWELIPNKFDISTLVPFESKVLVRDHESHAWKPAIWGFYDESCRNHPYGVLGGLIFNMCIPYEGNEHLRGKTEDCSEYYKTYEG